MKALWLILGLNVTAATLYAASSKDLIASAVTTAAPSVAEKRGALKEYPDFSAIYENVGQSVVNINVTQVVTAQGFPFAGASGDPMFDYFFRRMLPPQQQKYKQRGLGSGFILSNDGYILTNAHVVSNADVIIVKLSDKRECKAKLIGLDKSSDIALIKIEANNLTAVKIGNPNQLKPGNWVVAIGSPFGLENTITQGIVSALSRNLPDDTTVPFIQSDVPINPGNSGGPLINLNGEVVGVNSQIYSKSGGYMGIAFSIPIDYAMRIVEQLKSGKKIIRGRLGIAIQPLTAELAASFGLKYTNGALVNGVEDDSAAKKAGVQVGDIILKINGREVSNTAILPQVVNNLGANKAVELTIWRNNKIIQVHAITMAANEVEEPQVEANDSTANKIDKLGIRVTPLTAAELKLFSGKIKSGLVVQEVNGDAQFAGLAQGDIIVGIVTGLLKQNITSAEQLRKIISGVTAGQAIALRILRKVDEKQFATIFVPIIVNK
jgi:serine protease Do